MNEDKRVKIANALGTEHINTVFWRGWREGMGVHGFKTKVQVDVPDYFNDLNAMHEAEKILDAWQMDTYAQIVYAAVAKAKNGLGYGITATSAQRAEAFGKTLNLW